MDVPASPAFSSQVPRGSGSNSAANSLPVDLWDKFANRDTSIKGADVAVEIDPQWLTECGAELSTDEKAVISAAIEELEQGFSTADAAPKTGLFGGSFYLPVDRLDDKLKVAYSLGDCRIESMAVVDRENRIVAELGDCKWLSDLDGVLAKINEWKYPGQADIDALRSMVSELNENQIDWIVSEVLDNTKYRFDPVENARWLGAVVGGVTPGKAEALADGIMKLEGHWGEYSPEDHVLMLCEAMSAMGKASEENYAPFVERLCNSDCKLVPANDVGQRDDKISWDHDSLPFGAFRFMSAAQCDRISQKIIGDGKEAGNFANLSQVYYCLPHLSEPMRNELLQVINEYRDSLVSSGNRWQCKTMNEQYGDHKLNLEMIAKLPDAEQERWLQLVADLGKYSPEWFASGKPL
jgi:hypothetical protein